MREFGLTFAPEVSTSFTAGFRVRRGHLIHLNPVRAAMVNRPGDWRWSGHGEYLGKEKRGLIDFRPVMRVSKTVARYEAFIRETRADRGRLAPGFEATEFSTDAYKGSGVGGAMIRLAAVRCCIVWLLN